MLIPSALQSSAQNNAAWATISTYSHDLCKESRHSFLTDWNRPLTVALPSMPLHMEDSLLCSTHSSTSASMPQMNADKCSTGLHMLLDPDRGDEKCVAEKSSEQRYQMHGNKGKVPWNKGKKHSEETKKFIREQTRNAMRDPKIRERLRMKAAGSTQSSETKLKIKTAITNIWNMKKKHKQRQDFCLMEWKEEIADAARRGIDNGDVEYQWDSYKVILAELKAMQRHRKEKKGSSTGKSSGHRLKISEAIRAKWADPDYRKRVQAGLHEYLSKCSTWPVRKRGEPSNKAIVKCPSEISATKELNLVKKPPRLYKDPSILSKLEKLKQMRASRHIADEVKQTDLTERARLLMEEAKKAAIALEAAAAKDKNAIAPLLETQRLLAEATRSFEAVLEMRNRSH